MASQQKSKPILHCAHVADFYAINAELWGSSVAATLRSEIKSLGGAKNCVIAARYFLHYSKNAAREWLRAGGVA
jgi:hypothetical protein